MIWILAVSTSSLHVAGTNDSARKSSSSLVGHADTFTRQMNVKSIFILA